MNLIFFLKGDNPTALTRRLADASMLDKLKYLKEVAFFEGTELEESGRREKWEEAEVRIVGQYSRAELHALRKYGYSGLTIQQRAQAVGLGTMYSDIYRITSRSVHMFDPAETGMMDYLDDEVFHNELLSSRRVMLDSAQNVLLGRLAFLMSEIVDDALITVRMLALGLGYEKYRDKQEGEATVDHAESGTFYIWREQTRYQLSNAWRFILATQVVTSRAFTQDGVARHRFPIGRGVSWMRLHRNQSSS